MRGNIHRTTSCRRISPFQFAGRFLFVTALALCCVPDSISATNRLDSWLDLWPLLRIRKSADGSQRSVEALGPLIEWHDSPAGKRFFLRPLYNRREDRASRVIESEWLFPIGFGTRRPDLTRRVIFPLCLFENEKFPDGSSQKRNIVLPLIFQRSGRGAASFLLFPIGGVLHDFFGRDKIVMVLWPLYMYQEREQARSWSFPYPILGRIRWRDGGKGFKVWPLFGINRRPGKMLKLFVLWPIGHYQWMKVEQGELRRFWIWPFYGRIEDPGGWEWAVLWPLFSHRVDRNAGQSTFWYPWPFLGRRVRLVKDVKTNRGFNGWMFWPLFANKYRPDMHKGQFLWPFGWYRRFEQDDEKAFSFRIIPLMFRQYEESKAGRSGAWQLWPLVKYRYGKEGQRDAEFPSLMPMRYYGGWERNFAPLFRIFRYQRSVEGARSWQFLWRLIRVDSGPTGRYIEVAPLFKVATRRKEEPELRWSFLKGLIGYERVGGRRRLRLLYFLRVGRKPRVEAEATAAE